jgi:glycosyltransferase involved in cell wall biosynthesis
VSMDRKREARAGLGLPAQGTCLLFVGNDYRKKGLQALLQAMTQLPGDVVLAVVGNPAHIAEFRALAEALKLGSRVFFLGALKDVSPAYEAADILVHPTFEDTFAMVVLEAMAHGLPVVVSGPKYCGIAGLLAQGANALLLDDPRNAGELARVLGDLLGQPALRETLSEGATAFAAHYQWREIALQQEALYFSALAAKTTGS